MDPIMFTIGKFDIKWYSFLILVAALIGIKIATKEGKRLSIKEDFIFNVGFWAIIFGFVGARLYYVAFNWNIYENDILSIFKIWEGGLAIHGGLIFAILTIIIYCKRYNFRIFRILDIAVPSILLSQSIGRWGNFFNSEAYGATTTLAKLNELKIPQFVIDGMYINNNYYHPTFFYESIFCFVGFIIASILKKMKLLKMTQLSAFYLIWYGVGRFFIESLRTDSLMFNGLKVAQVASIAMIIIGVLIMVISFTKQKYENLYNSGEGVVLF